VRFGNRAKGKDWVEGPKGCVGHGGDKGRVRLRRWDCRGWRREE
jgi:hypothetical protein